MKQGFSGGKVREHDQWPFQDPKLEVPIPFTIYNYIRPKFQGISSPQNMARNMVQYLQLWWHKPVDSIPKTAVPHLQTQPDTAIWAIP